MSNKDREIEKKPIEEIEEEVQEEETLEEAEDQDVEDVEETEEETKEDEDDIDYDAELEALKEHKKHNFDNAKARIEKKKGTQSVSVDVDEIVSRVTSVLSDQTKEDFIEAELELIKNPKKRELVRHHYENSVVKSGISRKAIRDDIQKALAITDHSMLLKRQGEASEARKAKMTIAKGGAGGGQPSNASTKKSWEKVLTPSEIAFGKKRGWTEDMFKKAAEAKKPRP